MGARAKHYAFQGFDRKPAHRYSSRLMFAELDRLLEPGALAARGWKLQAESPLREWPRLAALDPAAAASGRRLRIDVVWLESDDGAPMLEGELGVGLAAVCQRCLEEMRLELRAEPKLFFGDAEALGEAAAAAGFEVCEPEPGTTLRQLLEDEVLLSIPAFPVHERSEDCGELAGELAQLEPAQGGKSVSSPFAVLADLKRKN